MGEIVVDIGLENVGDRELAKAGNLQEADVRRATVKAVADTGAVMLTLPEDVVDRFGVDVMGVVACSNADGRRGERSVAGPPTIRIGDRWMPANCVVMPTGTDALVGQVVMEQLDLVADCATQTLGPRPESPDRPLLRL